MSSNWSRNWWKDVLCFWRFFRKDSKRDVVIFLGPNKGGKTELYQAINNLPFQNKNEDCNTGRRVHVHKINGIGRIEEKAYGKLRFTVVDSGGEEDHIKIVVEKTIDHLIRARPDRVLVVLVVDIDPQTEKQKQEMTAPFIAQYLSLIAMSCEKKNWYGDKYRGQKLKDVEDFVCKRYDEGNWFFTVVGTHGNMTSEIESKMSSFFNFLEKYRGKMTPVGASRIISFELDDKKDVHGREAAREWMAKTLKAMRG